MIKNSYPFTGEPQKIYIESSIETKDTLVNIMNIDGNKFRGFVKIGIEPTIIKLDKKEVEDE